MNNALVIENLNKSYANGLKAVCDLNLSIKQGEFFALLGPNGAGKSTTIGVITSLVTKTSGKVTIFGNDIDTHFVKARRSIGLVPQEFNFNIFEPIVEVLINQAGYYGIPRKIAQESAEHYLNKLRLWDRRKDSARLLSGGMKRRLMIARALVHHPKLLILDEPTAGVDLEIRYSMWEYFQELNASGVTIILTTHYLEEAESLCRHVAIIDKGRIVEDTSIRQLINSMGEEIFILDLKTPINGQLQLDNLKIHMIDSTTIEIELSRETTINELFKILSNAEIEVLSMRNKSSRLEQFFLNLVSGHDKVSERSGI